MVISLDFSYHSKGSPFSPSAIQEVSEFTVSLLRGQLIRGVAPPLLEACIFDLFLNTKREESRECSQGPHCVSREGEG